MSSTTSQLSPLSTGGVRTLSSCRRGSMAAPDPFGTFPDSERGMSSTLTITRAPLASQDIEERAKKRRSAELHTKPLSSGRISFAFTAFSPQKETSPSVGHGGVLPRNNSFLASSMQSRLTPTQVCEMAQHCNYPQSQPSTPGGDLSAFATPISFMPLPDTVHLPFFDRPSEVQALVSTAPTSKMFLLLSQTFPSSAEGGTDPRSWSYVQLKQWLTNVDRDEADDVEWIAKARACITARSEPIWERVKGAFGVPAELDIPLSEPATSLDIAGPDLSAPEDYFGDAWVEPIVPAPAGTSPRPPRSLSRQSISRMEDISEDAPVSPSSPPAIQGLRVVNAPSSPTGHRESSPLPTSEGSFQPHVPYDVVAERGPGNPLFPSSFARLALGPTLSANNPALRSPSAPPVSTYPHFHSMRRDHRAPTWTEGLDPQKQEYAVSIASGSSRRSVAVDA